LDATQKKIETRGLSLTDYLIKPSMERERKKERKKERKRERERERMNEKQTNTNKHKF